LDAASSISAESKAVGFSLQQLTNLQGSISGVNTDEEATNLIRFQTAFEAAARIVSTIQHLNTVVLHMGSSGGY
jgi:flagellar hook-associated protein 1 FlgK